MTDATPTTRRALLAGVGAALATPAVTTVSGRTQATETFRIGSDIQGWVGLAPDRIADETNPTLDVEPGVEYDVVWVNRDGVGHNLQIRSDADETVVGTETVNEEGATRRVTFEASEAIVAYRCGIHAFSMTGEIAVGGTATTTTATSDRRTTVTATTPPDETTTVTEETTTTQRSTTLVPPTTTTTTTTTRSAQAGNDGDDADSDGGGLPGFGLGAAAAGLLGGLELRRWRRE